VTNSRDHIDDGKQDNVHQCQDKSVSKKLKSSAIDIETKTLQPEIAPLVQQQKTERNNQTEMKCEMEVADCNAQGDTKKLESRSARRKKIKRQMRQKAKLQTEKNVHEDSPIAADCPSSSNQDGLPGPSSNQNGLHAPFSSHKTDEEESDTSEDEIVPVVVRPGHIRFEPAGGQPDKSPAKEMQGNFEWSGTMSKKKGQKWGMNSSNKKNGNSMEANHHFMDCKITENVSCAVSNQKDDESNNIDTSSVKIIEEKFNGEPLDFERFYPLTRLPKEGDLIAYRLVELSSSLCPELSSYRV